MDDTDVRGGSRGSLGLPLNPSRAQALEESIRVVGLSHPPTCPLYRSIRRLSAPWFVSSSYLILFYFIPRAYHTIATI